MGLKGKSNYIFIKSKIHSVNLSTNLNCIFLVDRPLKYRNHPCLAIFLQNGEWIGEKLKKTKKFAH